MFTFLGTCPVPIHPSTKQQSSSSDHDESEGESDSNWDIDDSLCLFVKKKTAEVTKTSRKKGERKAQWSQEFVR